MGKDVETVTVTEFKAKCLEFFSKLEKRKVRKVVVTRHGKPVGQLTPPDAPLQPLFGAHRGSVWIAPGVDLTAPTFEEGDFDVERGHWPFDKP